MTIASPLNVFISYSHGDEKLKDELAIHLASLKREGAIAPWQDRDIEGGEEWDEAIRNALEAAQIILLLITPRFLASRYCFDEETKRAMERHNDGTARVIPIIMKPSDWKTSPFSKLQVMPKDGKPVNRWDDQDEALLNVVSGLRKVITSMRFGSTSTTSAHPSSTTSPSPSSFNAIASSDAGTSPPQRAPQSSTQQRLQLFQLLSSLPGPTFDSIVYALNVPPSILPPGSAAQGLRVPALLEWVQSPMGCGLDELEAVVNSLVPRNQNP
ncbi:MAG: toll/interleukin-1 receptor domain-containing protein [Cyanobacteria bacterium P01_A01_bin.37]